MELKNITPRNYLKDVQFNMLDFHVFTVGVERTYINHVYDVSKKRLRKDMIHLSTFNYDSDEFKRVLLSFASIDESNLVASRCPPRYTCGIVFRTGNQVTGAVSIDFGCKGVKWGDHIEGYADLQFYENIKEIFTQLGDEKHLEG